MPKPTELLHQWRPSTEVRERGLGTSGIFSSQTWLERTPIRPAAAWAVIAGLLASGFLAKPFDIGWPTLVMLFLLTDPLWSGIWRLAAGRSEILPLHEVEGRTVTLPYLQPDSPAAQLLDRNSGRVLPVLIRVGLPSVLLALIVASAIGIVAVGFTLLVATLASLGWIATRRRHQLPVLLFSIVSIGLPWLLTAWMLLGSVGSIVESWQWLLICLWVLHGWGAGRIIRFQNERFGLLLMAIADIGVLLCLIGLMAPLWLAFWLVCTLPVWIQVYRGTFAGNIEFWHLGAMLVSAAAVGWMP